jgi:parallel beta-helix repeat protein
MGTKRSLRRFETIAIAVVVTLGAFGALVLWAPGLVGATATGCAVTVKTENGADDAVQLALEAHAGGVVCVAAGSFPEQLTIAAAGTTLRGAGSTKTIFDPSGPLRFNTYDYDSASGVGDLGSVQPAVAIVLVDNTSHVTISGIGVSGAGGLPGPSSPDRTFTGCGQAFVGVDFQNSSGTLESSRVTDVQLPYWLFGCQGGVGVYAYNGYFLTGATPSPAVAVTVSSTTITAFDKGGIVCNDPGETCVLTGDTVTGAGPNASVAQNGIQVGFGALGTVHANHVSESGDFTGPGGCGVGDQDNYAVCSDNEGAGILLYDSAPGTTVTSNVLSRNEIGIYYGDDGTMDGGVATTTISSNSVVSSNAYGIVAIGAPGGGDAVTISHNGINNRPAADPSVWGAPGILVDTGTFRVTSNNVQGSLASPGASNGAGQAVCGPPSAAWWSPVVSCPTNQTLPTAAIEGASESLGNPTVIVASGNAYAIDTNKVSTLGVLGGAVDLTL